jgi:hypothetical protein
MIYNAPGPWHLFRLQVLETSILMLNAKTSKLTRLRPIIPQVLLSIFTLNAKTSKLNIQFPCQIIIPSLVIRQYSRNVRSSHAEFSAGVTVPRVDEKSIAIVM